MKKLLLLLLLLLLVTITISACSVPKPPPPEPETTKSKSAPQSPSEKLADKYFTKIIIKDYPGVRCFVTVSTYEQESTGISCISYQTGGN